MSIELRSTTQGKRRYEVRLRDASGKEYSRTFRTRKEAERFEATERADRARGSWIDPRRSSARFADVAAEWLVSHPGKKESTLARDQSVLSVHILPAIGDTPVGQLTPPDIQRLVNTWSTTLGARTVRRQYATLRAVLNLALDTDRIGRSPCRRIKLPEPGPVEHHIVSPAELQSLVEALGPANGALALVAAVLGLRWGECAGLRAQDVDLAGGTVSVAVQRTRGLGGKMITGNPKCNSQRTVSAPSVLLELVAEHFRARGLTGDDQDVLVFVGPQGDPLHYANWRRRVWEPACDQAGLHGLTFQALRAANGTAMVALAVDVKTAQTRAGHRDAKTTLQIYARSTAAADREAADRLGDWFLGDHAEQTADTGGRPNGLRC